MISFKSARSSGVSRVLTGWGVVRSSARNKPGAGNRGGRRMIRATRYLAAAAVLLLAATGAGAQSYPARPITIVVPAAPGGVTDMLGRILAKRLTEKWSQPAIGENKPGANNQLAAEYGAKAA